MKYNKWALAGFIVGPATIVLLTIVAYLLEIRHPNYSMILAIPIMVVLIPLSVLFSLIGYFNLNENQKGKKLPVITLAFLLLYLFILPIILGLLHSTFSWAARFIEFYL